MELKPGKYRHFKGKEYRLISIASHSELYDDGGLWVRPAAMWNEHVQREDYCGPRFIYIEE